MPRTFSFADGSRLPLILLGLFVLALLFSALHPKDLFTWVLEVIPAVLGASVLTATYRRFRFSDLAYLLIFLHALILLVGGHYTYAEAPPGFWMREWFGFERNNYDKIGHFAQGFVPAVVSREILLRTTPVPRGGWLVTIVLSICLAISALYELLEWAVAALTGEAAEAFLGMQGYAWDTQSDMLLALLGGIAALSLLSGRHDRSIERSAH